MGLPGPHPVQGVPRTGWAKERPAGSWGERVQAGGVCSHFECQLLGLLGGLRLRAPGWVGLGWGARVRIGTCACKGVTGYWGHCS